MKETEDKLLAHAEPWKWAKGADGQKMAREVFWPGAAHDADRRMSPEGRSESESESESASTVSNPSVAGTEAQQGRFA